MLEMYGAAAPGVMPKDTIKVKDDESFSIDTPNRSTPCMQFKLHKFLSMI